MPHLRSLRFAVTPLLLGALAAQGLVGVSFNGTLTRVNPASGLGTPLGSTGFNFAGGLARVADVLYTNDLAGNLWKIDPWTGAVSPGPATSPALNSIRAMCADRRGVLYVIQNGGGATSTTTPDQLYRVDAATGVATLVGSTSTFVGIQGLAFDWQTGLYGWDTNAGLVSISPTTAVTTDVDPGVGAAVDIQEIAFAPGGTLYGARHNLYAIDLAHGVPTLVGAGGYSDLRGLEYVHGPRIYDNGPVVTHPGGGFAGADLSMVEQGIGLTQDGVTCNWYGGQLLTEDFRTDGPWQVDAVEFLAFVAGTQMGGGVHVAIYDGDPATGGQLVPGSQPIQQNMTAVPGSITNWIAAGAYRAPQGNPASNLEPIFRVRVLFGQPLLLNSATTPSGRHWLQFSFDSFIHSPTVPFVTTLGVADTGDARQTLAYAPVFSNGHPQALPFAFYGTSLAAPGSVANLGGGCGGAGGALSVRGALCAGGTVVHELSGLPGLTGIVIGLTDPNAPISPLCSCVQHASTDVVIFPASRYDLVAPPGLGTGLEYRVQGLRADFTGTAGLPCGLGPGLSLVLTDALRVRFW